MPTLDKELQHYFKVKLEPLYEAMPWAFQILGASVVATASGLFIIEPPFDPLPAHFLLALVGDPKTGKTWAASTTASILSGIVGNFSPGSGEALFDQIQSYLKENGFVKGYMVFDEAGLLNNVDMKRFITRVNSMWSGISLEWETRRHGKIKIPEKQYVLSFYFTATLDQWSSIETSEELGGFARRTLPILFDVDLDPVRTGKLSIDKYFEIQKLRKRIRTALRVLSTYILAVGLDEIEDSINKKIKELDIPKSKHDALGDYLKRVVAARYVARQFEIPEFEGRPTKEDIKWMQEQFEHNLENTGINLIREFDLGTDELTFDEKIDPFIRIGLAVKAKSSADFIKGITLNDLAKKREEMRQYFLTLDAFDDPLNTDLTLLTLTTALAPLIQAPSPDIAKVVMKIEQFVRTTGKIVVRKKEFTSKILVITNAHAYKPVIDLLKDGAWIREIILSRKKKYVILRPEAKICGNCELFGTQKCPLLANDPQWFLHLSDLDPSSAACEKFELSGEYDRDLTSVNVILGGEANEIFVPHNL